MGRAQGKPTASSSVAMRRNMSREAKRAARSRLRAVVSTALNCECESSDEYGGYDAWYPDAESEVTLCVEFTEEAMSITRISCWPEGRGIGKQVVSSLRDHAEEQNLALEVPDPFETSLGFWRSFQWTDVGCGERVVLRREPGGS